MDIFETLTISHLDKQVKPLKDAALLHPKEGWIKKLRVALKMSESLLGKRVGKSQSSIHDMELREVDRGISLKALDTMAKSFGCKVVYGFVPETSFDQFIEDEQRNLATRLVEHTQKTMALEGQPLTKKQKIEQINLMLEEIKREPLKNLWKTHEI